MINSLTGVVDDYYEKYYKINTFVRYLQKVFFVQVFPPLTELKEFIIGFCYSDNTYHY